MKGWITKILYCGEDQTCHRMYSMTEVSEVFSEYTNNKNVTILVLAHYSGKATVMGSSFTERELREWILYFSFKYLFLVINSCISKIQRVESLLLRPAPTHRFSSPEATNVTSFLWISPEIQMQGKIYTGMDPSGVDWYITVWKINSG